MADYPELATLGVGGAELAEYLADVLSDLEFELLIRARVQQQLDKAKRLIPNLSDSHFTATFDYSVEGESVWRCKLGETYSKYVELKGSVLSLTYDDMRTAYNAQNRNKLSLLLAAEKPAEPVSEDIPF